MSKEEFESLSKLARAFGNVCDDDVKRATATGILIGMDLAKSMKKEGHEDDRSAEHSD